MILGIDVGGTHTDAVLIDEGRVRKKAKVATCSDRLLQSLLKVTTELLAGEAPDALERVVLSTTMSTNAVVQNRIDPVGMVLISGPGLPPEYLKLNEACHCVCGYMNHRGLEVSAIDANEIHRLRERMKTEGMKHVGIVGKFSTRNPQQEKQVEAILQNHFDHISLGHRISGHLNYPRRIATTYLNEAIWELYRRFIDQVIDFVDQQGIRVPIYILKADGGTIEIRQSVECPVQTILSGPSASIMGILSIADCNEDAIALDIGGTTTDIALFADGVPLLDALGVTISGHRTLIRGLRTRSIGVGGDSRIHCRDGQLTIGPEREGPAAALGGTSVTPTDAMIVLGLTRIGDPDRARAAVAILAEQLGGSVQTAAGEIFEKTCEQIVSQVRNMVEAINNQPVYTIHEMLAGKKITPQTLYVVGGPADAMAPRLGELLHCPSRIPIHAEVANAIGAALARTTAEMTLLADTEQGFLTIAEEGFRMSIPRRFTREDVIAVGREKLREKALCMGAREADLDMEIIEDQEFNMVREFATTGKNIRVKLQIKPGLIANVYEGGRSCPTN